MNVTLTGLEVDEAIKEYLLARGVEERAEMDVLVIGGRKGNKSTAKVTITAPRIEPITKISNTYAETVEPEPVQTEMDVDPYEEEEEEVAAPTATSENLFEKTLSASAENEEEDGHIDAGDEPDPGFKSESKSFGSLFK